MQIKKEMGHGEPVIQRIGEAELKHYKTHSYLIKEGEEYHIATSNILRLSSHHEKYWKKMLGIKIHLSGIKSERRAERLYKKCLSRGLFN